MDPTTTAMAEAMNQMARSTNWAWEQAYLGEKAAREALEKRITELEELPRHEGGHVHAGDDWGGAWHDGHPWVFGGVRVCWRCDKQERI